MREKGKNSKACFQLSSATNAYDLLEDVKEVIKVDPLRYDQTTWRTVDYGEARKKYRDFPACGTVGCVAGWVVTLTRGTDMPFAEIMSTARKILGLDISEALELFSADAAGSLPQTKAHTDGGIRHITRFQKKYKDKLKRKKIRLPKEEV